MYTIKNIAFQEAEEKYGPSRDWVKLDLDDIRSLGGDLGESPATTGMGKFTKIDKVATISKFRKANSFSYYMSEEYYEDRHSETKDEAEMLSRLKNHDSGDDTFQLYAELGLGFHNLAPGQEVEVDFTKSFVNEVLIGQSFCTTKKILIEGLGIKDEEVEVSTPDAIKGVDLMNTGELKKMAKALGKDKKGATHKELLENLKSDGKE